MAQITKLEVQSKHKNRVNVFLNDEFKTGCSMEIAVKHGLRVGVEIDESALEQIVFENEKGLALNKALALISKSLKTKKQVKDYLFNKGYNPNIVAYVLQKLCEYNYINDINYGKIFLRSVKNKSGKIKIVNELKLKGISKTDIDEIMTDFEDDEEAVFELATKYLKNKDITFENLNKLYRYLFSRGYNYEVVSKVIKKFKEKQ